MRNRLLTAFLCLTLTLCFVKASAFAYYDPEIANALSNRIDGGNFENYLSSGNASEWYIFAQLRRGVDADFTAYGEQLKESISNESLPAATRQRAALILILLNGENATANNVLAQTTGKNGIMSYVFALHLLNNSAKSDGISAQSVINAIMTLKLDDGGWAVRGNTSDVDVTAMVLQALAPYKHQYAEEIDRALTFLGEKQLEDGDYLSYGVANPESGAQVVIALTSLGIDPLKDERFIKNGKTLCDGIEKYFLPDGGVSHTLNGKYNQNASCQTYCAFVALERFYSQKSGLYIFEKLSPDDESHEPTSEAESSAADDISSSLAHEETSSKQDVSTADADARPYSNSKIIVCIVIGVITVAVILILSIKKRRLADILIVLAVGIALIMGVVFINLESTEEHYKTNSKTDIIGSVTVSVSCPSIGKSFITAESLPLADGETAFDLLSQAAKNNKIAIAFSGSGDDIYVTAIGGIGEFDYGSMSGWTYTVNGISPSVSASAFELHDGDVIEWIYVTE